MKLHERLGKYILADGMSMAMNLEESHGSYIKDNYSGDEYLDMFSMFASGAIGYNHPHLVENKELLGKIAINKPTLSDVYNEYFAEFVETFSRVAIPEPLGYSFFISGGGLAVENALKAAFDWKTRLNFAHGNVMEADTVIHFKQAFHGRTGYTMSLTNTSDPRKYMYFPKFDWPRVTNPKMHFPETAEGLQQTISHEEEAKAQIHDILECYGARVACVIIETIQGEGGDNFFRKEFHEFLRNLTEKNDILLIYDEVQAGVGITGKTWAWQHYGVVPDVMSFGKKTQVCGILANKEKFDRVDNHVFKESSRLNSTFGGNLVDMVRFKLILEVIEKENLVENAKVQGEYLLNGLKQLQSEFSDKVSNARGLGLWCAFDLPTGEIRDHLTAKAYENKMAILGCGDHSIRFRPHLNVGTKEIDHAMEIMRKSLTQV